MQGRILGSIIFLATVLPSLSIVVKDHQQVQRDSPRIETCSPLKNHQTYSSVEVAVGNPPQYFNLVADTGSNSCIVKDCGCKQCPKAWGNCFTGPKQSKSFDLPLFKVMNSSKSQNLKQGDMAPAAIVMSFGSGQIAAQIASDEVRIGEVKTYMEKGLLLMEKFQKMPLGHRLNHFANWIVRKGMTRPAILMQFHFGMMLTNYTCFAVLMSLIPAPSKAEDYGMLVFVKLLVWQHLAEACGCRQGPMMGQKFPNNLRYRLSRGTLKYSVFPWFGGNARNLVDYSVHCIFFMCGLGFLFSPWYNMPLLRLLMICDLYLFCFDMTQFYASSGHAYGSMLISACFPVSGGRMAGILTN
eukprot:symbB.v1.2.019733.t2/scaffold1626.1/size108921/7